MGARVCASIVPAGNGGKPVADRFECEFLRVFGEKFATAKASRKHDAGCINEGTELAEKRSRRERESRNTALVEGRGPPPKRVLARRELSFRRADLPAQLSCAPGAAKARRHQTEIAGSLGNYGGPELHLRSPESRDQATRSRSEERRVGKECRSRW